MSGIFYVMNWQGMNKRKFPRANYRCLLRVKRENREEAIETHTENIGVGGICVIIKTEFDLFSKVSLEIILDQDKDPIFCEGKIVWVVKKRPVVDSGEYEYDIGIEFLNMSDMDNHKIDEVVEKILGGQA